MIRQLSARCWYVNGDWEFGPPHFDAQAETRKGAVEVTDEGRPPAVLLRAVREGAPDLDEGSR